MIIKSIDINGFKSFADKTRLQFVNGITAVVGPNGSGKSNISDAVRWVLGEQSTKNLRGGNMEDVIFLGSDSRKPMGYAEVTLTIDNSDRSLNFDSDVVAVTRRFYRSHESEYKINGAAVRLKDVNELFMDTGLGRDGYSMIGQGKIDSIVGAKAGERRDIFEEASGISRFRYKKIESERKLAQAEDNLLRLNDIFAELDARIGPLKKQSAKAEKYLKLRDKRKVLEIGLWLNKLNEYDSLIKKVEKNIDICKVNYEDVEAQINAILAKEDSLSRDSGSIIVETEEVYKSIEECTKKIESLKGDIALKENTIKYSLSNIDRLREQIEQLDLNDEATDQSINLSKQQIEEKEAALEKVEADIVTLTTELNELIKESENFSGQIEALVLGLNEINAKSADSKVRKASLETSLSQLSLRREEINTALAELKESITLEENSLKSLNEEKASLTDEKEVLSNRIAAFDKKAQLRQEEYEELSSKENKLSLDIADYMRRVKIYEDLEANMEGYSYAVKSIMKAKKDNILYGIYSPVVKAIDVDKEYSIAIEVALGNAAQDIITDSTASAKKAVKYLKENKYGRATFLPIDVVEGRVLNSEDYEDYYGFVDVAANLCSCDEKFDGVVDSLLGRILIAEDLDSATTIAKKIGYKHKIVTLDGQVVNAGGSLTGGSLSKNVGLLSRSGQIEELKKKLAKSESEIKTVSKDKAMLEEKLRSQQSESEELKNRLNICNEKLIELNAQIPNTESAVKRDRELINSYDSQLAEIDKKSAECKEGLLATDKDLESFTAEESELQQKIDLSSEGRDDLLERREDLSTRITNLRLDKNNIINALETLKRNVNSLDKSKKDREYRKEQLKLEITQSEESIKSVEEGIEAVNADIVKAEEEKKSYNDKISELKSAKEDLEKEKVEIRREEKELQDKKENLTAESIRLEERVNSINVGVDEIINKLFEDYELTKSEAMALEIVIEDISEARKELQSIKAQIKALGNVNVNAIEEYKEVKERHTFYKTQIDDVTKTIEELRRIIRDLTGSMKQMFIEGFDKINKNFKKTFTDLFGGGTANLSLTDPEDVLNSGIDISVRIPGKTVSKIEPLSGGEKALVAISIYFAIMLVNPPPFCLLDEVESALDEVNVVRVAEYMHRLNDKTQFICITHRRGTMEAADMLYGVTMQEKGVSTLLELNVNELENIKVN